MKKFSKFWKQSSKARKQHKYRYNAPLHLRHKLLSANLSKDLRKKYGRNLPLRKGDTVRAIRGRFKKKSGKIIKINTKNYTALIDNMQTKKKDGSTISIPISVYNLRITELNLDDKKRIPKEVLEPLNKKVLIKEVPTKK